jgi:hypothetical protein
METRQHSSTRDNGYSVWGLAPDQDLAWNGQYGHLNKIIVVDSRCLLARSC